MSTPIPKLDADAVNAAPGDLDAEAELLRLAAQANVTYALPQP